MSVSKFTPEARGGLLERTAAGLSLADACRAVGVRLQTVKGWLARGRREHDGPYAEFVEALEDARKVAAERPQPLTADELRHAVSQMVRSGSVAAAKLYWEILAADRDLPSPADPFAEVDAIHARAVGARPAGVSTDPRGDS